jgi:ABC-type polysaccharide/polyol phosphate transport system ATPase subunit
MSSIIIKNLSLSFEYQNINDSLRELFVRKLKKQPKSEKKILNNISLKFITGEKIGIIGHNGAGKSSLLKAICNIYEHYSGTIKIKGNLAPLLEIGAGFLPDLTGRENIMLNCAILGLVKKDIISIEEEIINFSGLSKSIDQPVKYYSSGMYTRLAFSIATSISPEILILDEVFSAGDLNFVKKGKARINALIKNAGIVVIVSHDLSTIKASCNRVILMENGAVIKDGPTDEVIKFYKSSAS